MSPWFQWIIRAQSQGRLEAVLGELGFNILSTLKLNGFENHTRINDTWLRAYGSRFAVPTDSAGAIRWTKGFAIGAHRFEVLDAAALDAIRSKPALAIWGDADRTLAAEHFLPLFSDLFPRAPIHHLARVGHYSLEDAPQEITELIATFLTAHYRRYAARAKGQASAHGANATPDCNPDSNVIFLNTFYISTFLEI